MNSNYIVKEFNSKEALKLGMFALEFAKDEKREIAIEVYINRRIVFMYIPDSMNQDKQDWLMRKRNSVLYFGMATIDLNDKLKGDENLLVSKYALDKSKYTITAGSVPINVEGVGIVGAVTITGLKPEEDHQFAKYVLKEYNK